MRSTRRIVTGINLEHESIVLTEEMINAFVPYHLFPSFQLQNLFYTEENPQSLSTRHSDIPYNIELPEGAVRILKLRMPTKIEMTADLQKAGHSIPEDWNKFNLHRTDSVDYIYVLSGAITCIVGTQLLNLVEGDFLNQVGPEHTWINDHAEPCYLLCVMMGIKASSERKKMMTE